MPTETLAARAVGAVRRWWPEALLVVLASAAFLGCLGSLELWGKNEQRVSAAAVDTIEHQHWLAADIQGHAHVDEPPLPRWSIAALMALTGRRDEWIVRLPTALSALATVALVYLLGLRIGGRPVGLASALVLCSLPFYVGEMRQAGNDGLLAFFTTLSLYAVWRSLHDGAGSRSTDADTNRAAGTGAVWNLVLGIALGLGILSKGPLVLLITGVTVIPYLAISGRLARGLRRLVDIRAVLVFAALGLIWPAAVLLRHERLARIWPVEISERAGRLGIFSIDRHAVFLGRLPGLVLPWSLIAAVAVFAPCLHAILSRRRDRTRELVAQGAWSTPLWFPWWWGVGNLGMLGFWPAAEPNDYLACVPGMALLIGSTWVHLARSARGVDRGGVAARVILQAQWVAIFVAAIVAPLVLRSSLSAAVWPWSLAIGLVVAGAVVASAVAWRRGSDALTLAPLSAAYVAGALIVLGLIAPLENSTRSHRALAQNLTRLIPGGVREVMFFTEIDDGLWFYLNGFSLTRVPGCHPLPDSALELGEAYPTASVFSQPITDLEAVHRVRDREALIAWLDRAESSTPYLLIGSGMYERLANDLKGRVVPLFRETGMKRNELTLLQVVDHRGLSPIATSADPARR